MWIIQDFTGTLYTQHNTMLGHLLQSIYWLDNQHFTAVSDLVPWEYHNIANLVKDSINNFRSGYGIQTSPIVDPIDNYCSTLSIESARNGRVAAWTFIHIFDLQLHDAAVTYTHLAAKESSEVYAQIACTLWVYSRQLRVDAQRPECQEKIKELLA